MAFLRGCKFSLERSKEKLDMFYTLRSIVPEFYGNRDPLDNRIQEILKLGYIEVINLISLRFLTSSPRGEPILSLKKVVSQADPAA